MSEEGRLSDAVYRQMSQAGAHKEASAELIARVKGLPLWSGPVEPEILSGGLSNVNLHVEDGGRRYVVKVGNDLPQYGVVRDNEHRAMRAAHAAGAAPEVVHSEPGITVLRFIEGMTLTPEDVRKPRNLERIGRLIRRFHREAHRHLDGPGFIFWPFHHVRWYIAQLDERSDRLKPRWLKELPGMLALADELEEVVGPVRIVFSHNDILAPNLIDDGERLWLVDWEYSGYNADLFDLAGIASNTEMNREEGARLLEAYYERPADEELRRRFEAMIVVSCLRETSWSFLAEVVPLPVAFDYNVYSRANFERLGRMHAAYRELA